MPTYVYSKGGKVAARFMQMNARRIPKTITVGGETLRRDFQRECGTIKSGDVWLDGIWSQALGVNSNQIAEATAAMNEAGLPATFDRVGRLHITSRKYRNQVLKFMGMHDKEAGYGDRTPN